MLKKKGAAIISMLAAVLFILFAVWWVCMPQQRTALFVHSHQKNLLEIAAAHLNGDSSVGKYQSVEVDGVFEGDHPIVQFYMTGVRLVPYMGFYYSPDDKPAAYQNVTEYLGVPIDIEPVGEDEWKWTDGTDNRGITKRIGDCWYYYEAWF